MKVQNDSPDSFFPNQTLSIDEPLSYSFYPNLNPTFQVSTIENEDSDEIYSQQEEFNTEDDPQPVKNNLYVIPEIDRNPKTKSKGDKDKNDDNSLRKKFSKEEDEQLKKLVDEMGGKKWKNIAKHMPGRTGKQCRDRYKNYLVPGFFNDHWNKEEDEMLLKLYKELGPKWSKMSKFFNNRNANSLKNRWNYYVSKHIKDLLHYIVNKVDTNSEANTIPDEIKYSEVEDQYIQNDGFFESSISCNFLSNDFYLTSTKDD